MTYGSTLLFILPPLFAAIVDSWALFGDRIITFLLDDGSDAPKHISLATTKHCYWSILGRPMLHCIQKFLPIYGELYWPETWSQVHIMPLNRAVIHVAWKIAHSVIHTADRLANFGTSVDPLCVCGERETLEHLFFHCQFTQHFLGRVCALFFSAVPVAPSLECRHVFFCFNEVDRKAVLYFIWTG